MTWYDEVDGVPQKNFKFNFTYDKVVSLIGKRKADTWYNAFLKLPDWEIDSVERTAGFLAQCGHESAGFSRIEENLNYSWQSLRRVFGSRYFPTDADAQRYHRKPQMIANHVYMDENRSRRGALGNVYPGDGWRFRGRGLIQLTGRDNFAAFGETINMTPEEAVEYASTPAGAVESACWYWNVRDLNRYADRRDIVGMTKVINGGTNGLADREARWKDALYILGQ